MKKVFVSYSSKNQELIQAFFRTSSVRNGHQKKRYILYCMPGDAADRTEFYRGNTTSDAGMRNGNLYHHRGVFKKQVLSCRDGSSLGYEQALFPVGNGSF